MLMNKKHLKYIFLLPPVLLCAAALALHCRETSPGSVPIAAASEEERIRYLRSEGWEGELLSAQAVTVPAEETVPEAYAGLQRRQQLPLHEHAGTQGMVYLYSLRNSDLYAELLTADGILIGAQCFDPSVHVTLDIRGNTVPSG